MKITDTSKDKRIDWLFGVNPRAIENQEAQGQQELVNSSELPRYMQSDSFKKQSAIELYQSLGFKVNDDGDEANIFISVELPAGWEKRASDHAMWSYVHDEKGRKRLSVFYKAAFYDRSCSIHAEKRYSYGNDKVTPDPEKDQYAYPWEQRDTFPIIGVIKDQGVVIWKTEPIVPANEKYPHPNCAMNIEERLSAVAKQEISVMFTDFNNPLAYWD